MSALGLTVSVIGAVPVFAAGWYWVQRFQRGRRLLGFVRGVPIDIILTTSAIDKAVHGAPVNRPLTGYGQVRAVASCTRALVSLYPRKHVVIHLSGFIRNRLDRDLVALGGPAKNEVARAIVDDFVKDHDIRRFSFDDVTGSLDIADHQGQTYRVEIRSSDGGRLPDLRLRPDHPHQEEGEERTTFWWWSRRASQEGSARM